MDDSPAPLCLFVYKRIDTLKSAIDSLLKNELAAATDLHIFSDGGRTEDDMVMVQQVRQYILDIKGFKTVAVYLSGENKGLAKSIIDGVSKILQTYDRVIVLEDDLLVSSNFLAYMNAALIAYKENETIFSISGYTSPITGISGADVYFTRRGSSWGWATWSNRWEKIDWLVGDFKNFIQSKALQKSFNEMGSDLTHMLKKQMNGQLNSWAIRWVYHQFKYNLLTVFPTISKVINNGFNEHASNTDKINEKRFATVLDISEKKIFIFPAKPSIEKKILHQFLHPYSLQTRALYKVKTVLHSLSL